MVGWRRNHNQIQEVGVCFITCSYTYCSWLWVCHLKQLVAASWMWRPCWCGWALVVSVCVAALPRTETPWFFTLFLPRLSSKIVSILLMYCAKKKENVETGTEPQHFQLSGNHETTPTKSEVFFCSPYSVTLFWLPNWDSDVIVNRFSEILH